MVKSSKGFLFHGTDANDYDGCLDDQTSQICVRYHTSSNQKNIKNQENKIRGNSGYDKRFLHKVHIQEYWLTIYNDLKYEPPYIELTKNTKGVILPQYGQRKVTNSSYEHVHFLVRKYFSEKQKLIQHLHMLTHGEYI